MGIKPSDFTDIADSLHHERKIASSAEQCVRTVAGRAYYAVYLTLRDLAKSVTGDPAFNIGHNALASHLDGYENNQQMEALAARVKELKYFREVSDYWPDVTVDRASVGLALNGAKDIVRDAQKLRPSFDAKKLARLSEPQKMPSK
jgi:hypothetical protein